MEASGASNEFAAQRVYRFESAVMMPDFRGETVASARSMAAREALMIEIIGDGLAIDQDPSPGTVLIGRQKSIRVTFRTDS